MLATNGVKRLQHVPVITVAYAALLVLGYGLQQAGVDLSALQLTPRRFTSWALLTTSFLHVSPLHLIGNLGWLLLLGSIVEQGVRRYEYLLVLVVGGMVASAVQVVVVLSAQPESAGVPIVGASGVVAAIIGVFSVRFFATDLRLGRLAIPSLWVVMLWLAPQLVGAVRTIAEGRLSPVGYWGHLGGFMAGLVLALALRMTRTGMRSYLAQQLIQARSRGDIIEALRIARSWCQIEPDSVQAHLAAARAALAAGDENLSVQHYQHALTLCEIVNDSVMGVEVFREKQQHLPLHPLPPEMCLRWCLRTAQAGYPQEALEPLLQLAQRAAGTPEGESALLQAARIALQQMHQSSYATTLLERFLQLYPYSPSAGYARELLRQAQRQQTD